MHLVFRGVNEAFTYLVDSIHTEQIETTRKSSRNGEVLQIEEPMTITYINPLECVLSNMARDANPFFHLFEALWMLAGRNDLAPLKYYVSTFGQFSDDGVMLNGAYGYRWRHAEILLKPNGPTDQIDQLQTLIEHLKAKPDSRRAVLQMWNVGDDLLRVDTSKDVCCNLSALFSLRTNSDGPLQFLDMTVFNRSNDLVLGMLGANVVHFSFLLEYMANCLGVEVGRYNQISNNLHCYSDNFKPELWLADETPSAYNGSLMAKKCTHVPLVGYQRRFDAEVQEFIDRPEDVYNEPFLGVVAAPMCLAFRHHKEREYGKAMEAMEYVAADDWRFAGQNWLLKRKANYEAKNPYLARELPRQDSAYDID